ncbi:MAG: hypothetical protein ACR5LD_06495 [Symbiopectobacterium sp.]
MVAFFVTVRHHPAAAQGAIGTLVDLYASSGGGATPLITTEHTGACHAVRDNPVDLRAGVTKYRQIVMGNFRHLTRNDIR